MKRLRIVLSGLGLVIVLAVALMATARADVTATPQGTRYRYLDDVLEERSTVLRAQRWEAPLRPLVLPVSASEALEVRKHIGEAGAAFGVAHGTGEINLLAGWFGDAALARVEKAAATAFAKASRMAVLRHTFRPEFHGEFMSEARPRCRLSDGWTIEWRSSSPAATRRLRQSSETEAATSKRKATKRRTSPVASSLMMPIRSSCGWISF